MIIIDAEKELTSSILGKNQHTAYFSFPVEFFKAKEENINVHDESNKYKFKLEIKNLNFSYSNERYKLAVTVCDEKIYVLNDDKFPNSQFDNVFNYFFDFKNKIVYLVKFNKLDQSFFENYIGVTISTKHSILHLIMREIEKGHLVLNDLSFI